MTIMAMDDRVQLKREEVVGNEVVLTDINPKTSTNSIDDPVSGDSLNKIIERLWNAINNKLSRIVNSVNGRTGVVVLDSSDVGLGNVDNVSLADIKKWVIERTIQEFHNKRIELFDSLEDVDDALTQWNNDEAFVDKPYYSHHGYKRDGDMRGYIGYIYQDPATGNLQHTFDMVIDTVGWTDNSVIYNENLSEDKDFHGGGLGVNIWKYEEALQLYNNAAGKSDSGLRIDATKITPDVYCFDGVYGNGDPNDQNALLYFDRSTIPNPLPKTVTIKIDGKDMSYKKPQGVSTGIVTKLENDEPHFIRQSFKMGDIIICNFNSDNYATKTDCSIELINKYMNPLLMFRNTAIGQVTEAPTLEHPETNYTIEFFTLRPNIYRGLKEYDVNTKMAESRNGKAIGVSLLEYDMRPADYPNGFNMSGINALEPYNTEYSKTKYTNESDRTVKIVTPMGDQQIPISDTSSAMYISPNYSMCTFPAELYNPTYFDGVPLANWPPAVPDGEVDPILDDDCRLQSFLSVNLIKSYKREDHIAINRSGLRINNNSYKLTGNWFGQPEKGDDVDGIYTEHSGGISVNVGKFLEIDSTPKHEPSEQTIENYYDDGKVNVRIDTDKSLYDTGGNKLGVRLVHKISQGRPAGGLVHSPTNRNTNYGLTINRGMGIKFSKYDSMGIPMNTDDQTTVGVNIKDFLNTHDSSVEWGPYGGLRFVNDDGDFGSFLSIRVNENDTWMEKDSDNWHIPTNYGEDYQVGSEGLKITDRNVLGIQLQRDGLNTDEYGNSDNPLYIESNEEWLISTFYRKGLKPPKKLVTVTTSLDSVSSPNPDYVYLHHDQTEKDYYFYHVEGETGKWIKILNYYQDIDELPGAEDVDASAIDKLFIVGGKNINAGKIKVLKWQGTMYEELSGWFGKPTPGLRMEYNREKGLYTGTTGLFDTRKLAVNIYDITGGDNRNFANEYNGGLRFSIDGTIAIRLNRSVTNNIDGDKGLCIDNDNVLGVKIDSSRSDLDIDNEGNLIISDEFKEGLVRDQQPLTIIAGDKSIKYDGTEPIEIELGPGLRFVDEDTYNELKATLLELLNGGTLTTRDLWFMYNRKIGPKSGTIKHVISVFDQLKSDTENDKNSVESIENIINEFEDIRATPEPDNEDWEKTRDIWMTWTLDEILTVSEGLIKYLNDFEPEQYQKSVINAYKNVYNTDISEKSVSEVIDCFTNETVALYDLIRFLYDNLKYIYAAGLKQNPYRDELLSILDSRDLTSWKKWWITGNIPNLQDRSAVGHVKFFNKLKMDVENNNTSTEMLIEYTNLFKTIMELPDPVADDGYYKEWDKQKEIWLQWSLDEIWQTARSLIQYLYDNEPDVYQSKVIAWYKYYVNDVDLSEKSVSDVIKYYISYEDFSIAHTVCFLSNNLDIINANNLMPTHSDILKERLLDDIDNDTLWVKWNVFKSATSSNDNSVVSVEKFFDDMKTALLSNTVLEEQGEEYEKYFDTSRKLPLPEVETEKEQLNYQDIIWENWTFNKLINVGSEFITYLYKHDQKEYKIQVIDRYKQDYDIDLTDESIDSVIRHFTNGDMSLPDFVKFMGLNLGYVFATGILSFPAEFGSIEDTTPTEEPSDGE